MSPMSLKVLLPHGIFIEAAAVTRIVAETSAGSFGLLPRRLDCVAALIPGILIYQTTTEDERYIAVDQGVLIKAGGEVVVSVRHALAGTDLQQLRQQVTQEFLTLDEHERNLRSVMAKLESGFLRRFAGLKND
ncbi:F-type H+-transporting ATPase subunit epsilon [Marinobacterium sp. MBR-109]|jgi:F-type H+-transporting ATPase subunit epsilon